MNAAPFDGDDNGYLYHFTTPDGLSGILDSDELWLTNYQGLTDARELKHGLTVAREVFNDISSEVAPDTISVLDQAVNSPIPSGFFVTCFSMLKESPTHWRAFADDARGAAVAFELLGFESLVRLDPPATNLTRVAYLHTVKRALFEQLAKWTDEVVNYDSQRSLSDRKMYLREVQRVLPEILSACKDEKYESECEVRLVAVPCLSDSISRIPVRNRTIGSRKIEYISTRDLKTDFSLPIVKIVVGPDADKSVITTAEKAGVPIEMAHR
jgi:hypothetical protein